VKVFYDTEFIEDGRTIDLISIGMVAEDGRELYLIAEEIEADPLYSRICKHDWLMANVVPHLPLKAATDYWKPIEQPSAARVDGGGRFALDPHDNRIMPRRMLRNAVREFLAESRRDGPLELWASYGAYDHVVLAQLFGPMIRLPEGVPMWTHDLQQYAAGRDLLPQTGTAHDALEDARWLRDAHRALSA
jgi:hypothetical protein